MLDDEPSTRTLSGFRAHRKAGGVKLLCELLCRVCRVTADVCAVWPRRACFGV